MQELLLARERLLVQVQWQALALMTALEQAQLAAAQAWAPLAERA